MALPCCALFFARARMSLAEQNLRDTLPKRSGTGKNRELLGWPTPTPAEGRGSLVYEQTGVEIGRAVI